MKQVLAFGFATALAVTAAAMADDGPAAQAKKILAESGARGGLIVHVGCGSGDLTAALRASDSYIVQGLDADGAVVEKARAFIRSAGLYGPVSVEPLAGDKLPYADNLVNLVVADELGKIPMAEVMRVLCPNGAAMIAGRKTVKPRPGTIDEWTHFLHDAGNNAVARDTQVGPPRRLQWLAGPLWLRSHETPSGFEAMVAGGGRVFYLLDEGLIGITDQRLPERWALICRDAFNGKLLWRRPVEPWGWPEWASARFADKDWTTITGGRTAVPSENQRRIVVEGDRLFATLGYDAPISILDAATGKVLATVAETAPARQIAVSDGVAVVFSSKGGQSGAAKRRGKAAPEDGPAGKLIAVGADGKLLWQKPIASLHGLSLAIEAGRVIFQASKSLDCLDLKTGKPLWQVEPQEPAARTLVACDGCVVLRGKELEVRDAATGKPLWHKQDISSMWGEDLFVIDGVVWPGMQAVKDADAAGGKADDVRAVGYALKTGEPTKPVFAADLLSPEHHHRCYRNKATDRYLISSMEGAEFLDLRGGQSLQNNFVRGACTMGMVPCNGMLYVPPDQCFCQPGGKLLGLTALLSSAGQTDAAPPLPDEQRLTKGPAFGQIAASGAASSDDWPTFRHDAARHGATAASVPAELGESWRVKLGAGLTAPVVAGGRAYAAAGDTHTVHAMDLATGKPAWSFTAGGRIDSAPTVFGGMVLFGCADGCVYCLRADDGVLAWRFLAAPADLRIMSFDQVESIWPVHGSVLVRDAVAYVAAGRSTYLDGGIRLWALDPATGGILHRTTLSGPLPDGKDVQRDVAFFVRGANADLLVSEAGAIFMRQKRLTPSLKEEDPKVLSAKGESDVGLHVFSTSGLLDGSWYNRTFWMYSKRWPGFQLANQAPKSGQLLCVDEKNTYGVKVFYRRNVHSTMFFPGKEGYLIFADRNSNEPQIVGEPGSRKPLAWLPQSDYDRGSGRGIWALDKPAFGLDKMIGYTRAEPPLWAVWVPVRARAMVKAGDTLFLAGEPDVLDPKDPYAAFEGRKGAKIVAISAADGKQLAGRDLDTPPVFDGMIAVPGRLLVALTDGSLVCLAGQAK
jgi:outer membrane protein assembly factor BamB